MAASRNRRSRHGIWALAVRVVVPVILAVMAYLAAPPAQAEIAAKLQAEELARYARLVITFDRLPKYRVRVNTGVFVLEFDEPVSLDVSKLIDSLEGYVAAARLDPDGGAMRLALSRIVTVNTMEAGEQLFIDFLPQGWTGLPPGLPEEVVARLAQRAKEAEEEAKLQALRDAGLADLPQVKLAIGQNPTFTRLEFEWDRTVDAKVTRDRQRVTIQFNAPGSIDLTELRAIMPRFINGSDSDINKEGMVVSLTVDRTAGVRAFADGKIYTVDVAAGADVLAGDANLRAVAPQLEDEAAPGNEAQLATDLPGETPAPKVAALDAGDMLPVEITSDAFDPQAYEAEDYADWLNSDGVLKEASGVPGTMQQDQADTVAPDTPTDPANGQGAPMPAQTGRVADGQGRSEASGSVRVAAERIGKSVRLTFPFPQPVSSAVFNRGNTVWMVFDSDLPIDLGSIERELNDRASEIKLTRSGNMQYLRVVMSRPELTTAAAEASLWVVTIGDMIMEPSKPLALRRTLGNDGQSLVAVDLPSAGRVHWLRDPEVGDDIAIVTALGPARGLLKPQDFVEFTAFPSAHGLALRSLADDLRVSLRINEVIVSRNGGLWLSAGGAQQYAPGRRETGDIHRPGFVDFAGITHAGRAKFTDSRQELEMQAAVLQGEAHLPAQMTLARFYIGHQLAAEALGLLANIAEHEAGIEDDPAFNALRGIANLLMGREEEARKDLSVHGLSQSRDIKLWRGILELSARNWRSAQLAIKEGESAIDAYPAEMQAQFRLAGARAAIEVKDLADAAHHLEALSTIAGDEEANAQVLLLTARLHENLGRMDEAIATYESAKATNIRPVVAEATMHELALQQRLGTVSDDEALDKLETLAVVWRGDDIELETLKMLSELNASKGNYRRAFEIMRLASQVQPDAEITRYIQDHMANVFHELFLGGGAEKMPAVEALALYYDFRDLTPVGRLGDDMIRRLADRLVEVDLLDQASDLLAYQIDNRLRGAARAQVAGRLATIYLMARQPAKAINVLQRTRVAGLPGELQRQRSMLEARALSETGRVELALELLDTLQGDDADRLRADTLWHGRKWQELAEHLERTLGDAWSEPGMALAPEERYDVMRTAIGYSMANDQIGLDRLHTKYAKKMSQSTEAHSFEVVTAPIPSHGEEFLALAKKIASIDTLEAFLQEMQKQYGNADTPEDAAPPPS